MHQCQSKRYRSKTKVLISVDPAGKLKFLEYLFSPVKKERPDQSLSFRNKSFLDGLKSPSLEWSWPRTPHSWSSRPRLDLPSWTSPISPEQGQGYHFFFNSSIQIIILNEFDLIWHRLRQVRHHLMEISQTERLVLQNKIRSYRSQGWMPMTNLFYEIYLNAILLGPKS